MLTRAFLDDPVVAWAFRAERARPRALERFQATRLRQLLEGGEVWATDDLRCAALWAVPGQWRPGPREEGQIARCFLHPRLIGRLPLATLGWQLLERRHPAAPEHWYWRCSAPIRAHKGADSARPCSPPCSRNATVTACLPTWSPRRNATSTSTRATAFACWRSIGCCAARSCG